RRVRKLVEQRLGRENESRRAVTALQRAEFHERFLQGMQFVFVAQAFDSQNLAPVVVEGEKRAGAHRLAVEQHRAGAADLNIAAELRASQSKLLAHELQQRQPRLDLRAPLHSVDFK